MASKENIYNSVQNLYNMDKTTWQEVLAELYNLVYQCEDNNSLTSEEIIEIENNVNKIIDKKIMENNGWWKKLLNKNDTSVSSSSLLLVPMVVLVIEVIFNHTVQTDLNGMAAYITSVAALFATGGIVKGWINYNDSKTNIEKYKNQNYDSETISDGD